MQAERVRVTRRKMGHDVTVTIKDGDHTVTHTQNVLGATQQSVSSAVRTCRKACAVLMAGIKEA
jgi:hypothetical protein